MDDLQYWIEIIQSMTRKRKDEWKIYNDSPLKRLTFWSELFDKLINMCVYIQNTSHISKKSILTLSFMYVYIYLYFFQVCSTSFYVYSLSLYCFSSRCSLIPSLSPFLFFLTWHPNRKCYMQTVWWSNVIRW